MLKCGTLFALFFSTLLYADDVKSPSYIFLKSAIVSRESETMGALLSDAPGKSINFLISADKRLLSLREGNGPEDAIDLEKKGAQRVWVIRKKDRRLVLLAVTKDGIDQRVQKEKGTDKWEAWENLLKLEGEKKNLHAYFSKEDKLVALFLHDGKPVISIDGKMSPSGRADLVEYRVGVQADGKIWEFGMKKDGVITGQRSLTVNEAWEKSKDVNVGFETFEIARHTDGRLELFARKKGLVYHTFQKTPNGEWANWARFGKLDGVTSLSVMGPVTDYQSGIWFLTSKAIYVVYLDKEWKIHGMYPAEVSAEQLKNKKLYELIDKPLDD